jgi:hypothetical protein
MGQKQIFRTPAMPHIRPSSNDHGFMRTQLMAFGIGAAVMAAFLVLLTA